MYRTSNVARLAGATSLLAILAVWGGISLLAVGETTVTTWALGLASMFPISAILLGIAGNRSPPRTGMEYALGLVGSVVALSLAYIGVAVVDLAAMRTAAGFDSFEILVAGVGFVLLGAVLALVDLRYVERPDTAALLEERYLDEPVGSD